MMTKLTTTHTTRLAGFFKGAGEVLRATAFYSVAYFFSYPYADATMWQIALVAVN